MPNNNRSTAEFTYTVRISKKGGRRLGLVLVDSEEPPPKPRSLDEPEKPQTTSKIEEALRRADAELQQARQADEAKKKKEAEEKEAESPPKDVTPGSEDDAKKKEEKEKVQVSPHLLQNLRNEIHKVARERGIAVNPKPAPKKRKRTPTKITISDRSAVLKLAKRILSDDVQSVERIGGESSFDPSNCQQLIERGRRQGLEVFTNNKMRTGVDDISEETLTMAMCGTFQVGDMLDNIRYSRSSHQLTNVAAPIVEPHGIAKRRSRDHVATEHYNNLFVGAKKFTREVIPILKDENCYPLYLTFKRRIEVKDEETSSPPAKRARKTASRASTVKNEVIDLLESSDDEMPPKEDGNAMEIDSPLKPEEQDTCLAVPADPIVPVRNDDDFVLTPYGPGKIISSRIDRHAVPATAQSGSLYNPVIIYTVDLHYGICHVPANQVKPISGSHYTEKVLLTYEKVPITAHDLLRLRPLTYLNDSIMNFYLKHLKKRYDESRCDAAEITEGREWDDLDGKGCHVFPSFTYTRIKNILAQIGAGARDSKVNRERMWKDIKTWHRGEDLFKKRLLLFPINERLHWTILVVVNPGRLMRRYKKELEDTRLAYIDGDTPPEIKAIAKRKPGAKRWRCDFCSTVYDTFMEAEGHEKFCLDHRVACMIHFDSGKSFHLHNMNEIASNIRRYLNAYYDAEYGSSSHTGFRSFTQKNLVAFSAMIPQQDNTKDCGVYTLENAERVIANPPNVDHHFILNKGDKAKDDDGNDLKNGYYKTHVQYSKDDIVKKREDILRLIENMRLIGEGA